MGACALVSLLLYAHAFEAMAWLLGALNRSSAAYGLFLTGSHGLALFIMLPATFCAGTTLPLINPRPAAQPARRARHRARLRRQHARRHCRRAADSACADALVRLA